MLQSVINIKLDKEPKLMDWYVCQLNKAKEISLNYGSINRTKTNAALQLLLGVGNVICLKGRKCFWARINYRSYAKFTEYKLFVFPPPPTTTKRPKSTCQEVIQTVIVAGWPEPPPLTTHRHFSTPITAMALIHNYVKLFLKNVRTSSSHTWTTSVREKTTFFD